MAFTICCDGRCKQRLGRMRNVLFGFWLSRRQQIGRYIVWAFRRLLCRDEQRCVLFVFRDRLGGGLHARDLQCFGDCACRLRRLIGSRERLGRV